MSANTAEKIAVYYPALAEMGIVRFHEIAHFSLRQEGQDRDVLRVIYKRAKGSLLPYSRKYKFGRSSKAVIADGGTGRMETTYEISPFLLKAVAELESLVELNRHDAANAPLRSAEADLKGDLLAELDELEALFDQSMKSGDGSAVSRKIDIIRSQVRSI